ncbi:DUF4166 domain-containing protein [Pseudophaeobacter sp.]|uniref:DUF4166 domain-containing protein n=1 Tax=Pseudophaeobacter sp. TaxID=1971739 RepID=UPI003296834E
MSDAFARIVAEKGLRVPSVVARFHAADTGRYRGSAKVEGGNLVARLIARFAGFPPPGLTVDFEITTRPEGEGHLWSRRFGRSTTSSYLRYDNGRHRAVESFGPIRIEMGLRMQGEGLAVDVLRTCFMGIPLPVWLTPRSVSSEFETSQGDFGFDISASLPGVGLLVRYQGSFEVPMPR